MNATINGIEVTLLEAPGFSYSLLDYISGRVKGSKATTIRVAATNAARQILGSRQTSQRAAKEYDLRIGSAGATYWRSRVRPVRWSADAIELEAVAGNASWMDQAKSLRMRSLKMGSSRLVSAINQRASWTTTDDAIHYPVIDYGSLDGRDNTYNVAVSVLRPAARWWNYIAAGFQAIGYAVKARGRFERLSKRIILPSCDDNVVGDADTLVAFTSTVLSGPFNYTVQSGQTGQNETVIPATTIASDTSGSITGNFFRPGVRMQLTPRITGTWTRNSPNTVRLRVRSSFSPVVGIADAIVSDVFVTAQSVDPGPIANYVLDGFQMPTIDADPSLYYRVALVILNPNSSTIDVQEIQVDWQPTLIPYQAGITFDIASASPDWTLAEMVSNMLPILNVKMITDDRTGTIEFWHYDDFLAPITEGLDWTTKGNLPIEKVAPDIPTRYLFRYSEDDQDTVVNFLNDIIPAPGYGNADVEMGGTENEVEITTDFAPTAMGLILDAVYAPLMRDDETPYQQDSFKRVQRVLIADGVTAAEWLHDGTLLEVAPRVYFILPGETKYSLSFGDERWAGTVAGGTVSTYYSEFLRRVREAFMAEGKFLLRDHELIGLDLRRPVRVFDGFDNRWFYITDIEQKRFGVPEYTMVKLIQA